VTLVAILSAVIGDSDLWLAQTYVAIAACLALGTAVWTILRSQAKQSVEAEFAAWYQVPPGQSLVYREGWWCVEDARCRESAEPGVTAGY
jgi:hypothetical protein